MSQHSLSSNKIDDSIRTVEYTPHPARQPITQRGDPALQSAFRSSSGQRLNLNRQHRWKVLDDRSPGVSGIGRCIHLPAGGAEIDAAFIESGDGHRVAQYVHVAMALRETFCERLPLVSARAAAVNAQLSIQREVFRVAFDGDYVDGLRLVRVNVRGETKISRQVPADLLPGVA